MADSCSHQDSSRREVSITAHMVAFMRSMEPSLYKESKWFDDPYAEALAGPVGLETMMKFFSKGNEGSFTPESLQKRLLRKVSTRTKIIDDYLLHGLQSRAVDQIVVFGAGLDTRPWRLTELPTISEDSSEAPVSEPHLASYFEIDFPEIFDFKRSVLESATPPAVLSPGCFSSYRAVSADVTIPSWPEALIKSGFDASKRTLWIMEGFSNYLTEEELIAVMSAVAELSAPGSLLTSTYVTSQPKPATKASSDSKQQPYRFFTEDPLAFCERFGWHGTQDDLEDLAVMMGRPAQSEEDQAKNRGTVIVRVTKL